MDISEKANGFSPGRLTVRRTVRTAVRSTLAVSSRLPSLPVVGVAWWSTLSLAAFRKRRSSLALSGSS